ncbi:nucleoside-diphosphate sugar epimerase/dehydratase [Tumebacillus sp. DT12]|uniref:Nucleoside-diphosphate sugar epimerase/dehydratase n=2 Tax=Tumebacillus lacus TaxID=2995335 RepID=A0ABT3X5C2_9BACL|nr:nucleoside-diphosphate sugar epimerase/dehydratase [Tumebacillus lacus]MCX7572100.1 nucleoside-diphosphate sugar epimerase/dehydratase [Tumebacillus lacus]
MNVKIRQRMLVLAILDGVIIASAVVLAYLLRFDFQIVSPYVELLPYIIWLYMGCTLLTYRFWNMYRRVWQYASLRELMAILKATTTAAVVFVLLDFIIDLFVPGYIVPRSIAMMAWAFTVLGVGGSRFAWRMFRDSYFEARLKIQPHQQRTLIIGAGYAGALVAKELLRKQESDLYPVAFIDDDAMKLRREIMGLPVVGGRDKIHEAVEDLHIGTILVAMPSMSKAEVAKVLDICKTTRANIRILPAVSDFVTGKVSMGKIREVRVEDLLGRDPVNVDLEGVANYVSDQVVLVTGAGGSIGSELCRQISPFRPSRLILLGHGENSIYEIELELRGLFPDVPLETIIADVQDRNRMEEVFDHYRPAVVFHAAAHKHVPLMERNPAEAVRNNVQGTRNVAECAHRYHASHFVLISSDKAVNPTSVMGVTKRVAEMIVQGLGRTSKTKFVAVRFGNVLGSRGSVIPVFKRQIAAGGPVTITHPDMVRYFMTIPEAVQLVIQAGALAQGGEIFILDMGEPVKIMNLARDLIRLSGFDPDKDIRIVCTGIRPGEKLFEEILTNEEGITATMHNRIFVGQPLDFSLDELHRIVQRLEMTANQPEIARRELRIRELLLQAVPTYQWAPEENKASAQVAALEIKKSLNEVAVAAIKE